MKYLPIAIESLFDINFLSDIKLSPDGKNAAFVVTNGSVKDNNYKSNIWIYEFSQNAMKRLTTMDSEKNITWLNNEAIMFSTVRNDTDKETIKNGIPLSVYYAININGGEAMKLFDAPLSISVIRPLYGNKYLALASYDHSIGDTSLMTLEEREKAFKNAKEERSAFTVFDEIPFWANGQGVINKKRTRLYLIDTEANTQTAISPEFMNVSAFKYDKVANRAIYHGTEYTDMMELKSEVHIFDVETNTDKRIKLDSDYMISTTEIIDNQIVFFGILSSERDSCKNSKWHKVSLDGGKPQEFTNLDISLGSVVGSDCRFGGGQSLKVVGNDIYYISSRGYSSYIFKLDMDGVEIRVSEEVSGDIDCFDIAGSRIVFIGTRNKGLQEIYLLENGKETAVSGFNKCWLENHNVSYPEHFTFKNRDGIELDGFVIKPANYDEAKKYPAILDIHGGPKVLYGDVLMHEMQLWANEGYFVFFTNPRGSCGKGSEFASINAEKYGVLDYNDIMDFTDKVLELYENIDRKRLGVTGGSYGGLMTNWIVGRTDRFKVAATQRSISNFVSKCLTTDIGYYHNLSQMGTTPWQDVDTFWQKSPLKDADKVKTPLLFIHSDQDYRCYMADAFQFFTALKMFGVETRMCLFHGENHDLSRSGKPKNRMKRLEEITNWMNKFLKP